VDSEQAGVGGEATTSARTGPDESPLAASPSEPAVLTDEERGERLSQLNALIELMRPAVQADGGDLALLSADVVTGVVEVQLQGACSSCAVSSSTLQGGVERILQDRLPWVTEVLGGVDESVDPFESESMGRGGYVPSF
jgi:Fe-S cluster biogenesis protein NfuA